MHPADRYVVDVLSGAVPVCKWVQLACRRHMADLETGQERGLWFDPDAAEKAIAFFGFLKHYKGEWAGSVMRLEPWQQFLISAIFGWKRDDGLRRFRTAYLEVPRKNGKTLLAAGVGLYLLDADEEPGAEVYAVATKKDQARIAHSDATQMVKASPFLRRRIGTYKDSLHVEQTVSKFIPLGRDSDSLDGLNAHGTLADEVHAWRNRDLWDVMETASGSRRQPLMFAITTAGFDRQSLCWEQHDYTTRVLDGAVEDDSWFGMIYSVDLDEESGESVDDVWEESTWRKANPNYGVSVKPDDIRRLAEKAKEMPSAVNAFLRLRLDIWTQASTRWMNFEKWQACGGAVSEDGLRGRRCYGGLDLSTTTDIAAFVLVFSPIMPEDPYQVLCRFWVPEEAMRERVRRDKVPYDAWVRQGYLQATPGNVIDYDYILDAIDEDAQRYDIKEIAFDRWGATRITQQLQEMGGDDFMIQFGQGYASMSAPMKELEKLVLGAKLAHGGHPVLSWMAGNVVATRDAADNIKPDKAKSSEKIDGIVALIMALDRALRRGGATESVYEERGVLTL